MTVYAVMGERGERSRVAAVFSTEAGAQAYIDGVLTPASIAARIDSWEVDDVVTTTIHLVEVRLSDRRELRTLAIETEGRVSRGVAPDTTIKFGRGAGRYVQARSTVSLAEARRLAATIM